MILEDTEDIESFMASSMFMAQDQIDNLVQASQKCKERILAAQMHRGPFRSVPRLVAFDQRTLVSSFDSIRPSKQDLVQRTGFELASSTGKSMFHCAFTLEGLVDLHKSLDRIQDQLDGCSKK